MRIETAEQFEALMQSIDAQMRAENVPIPGRELKAYSEVAKRLRCVIPLGTEIPPEPGNYAGPSLAAHIRQWIAATYGDRLRVDLSYGYSVVNLRGDAWLLGIPIVFGRARFVAERDITTRRPNLVVSKPSESKHLTINVVGLVRELPQGMANQLSDDELDELLDYFIACIRTHTLAQGFFRSFGSGISEAARADLTTSAKHAVAGGTELGLSRWASLQAAEKFLKLYLMHRGYPKPPQTHKLQELVGLATARGMPTPPPGFIDEIQCDAGVRYEQRPHRVEDVIRAHQNSMRLAYVLSHTLVPIPYE